MRPTVMAHTSCYFSGPAASTPSTLRSPIVEEALLTGPLEETNLPYAVAKIAGKTMCDAYAKQYGFNTFTVMPCNVYGVGDNFHPEHSHVIAGMMRRFHEAKVSSADRVTVWGTGSPLRELIDADDLADACVFLLSAYDGGDMVNTGSGQEISIRELALLMKSVVQFDGDVRFDSSRPDGTPRKLMDNSKLSALGWRPSLTIEAGLAKMYRWFVESGAASAELDRSHVNPVDTTTAISADRAPSGKSSVAELMSAQRTSQP